MHNGIPKIRNKNVNKPHSFVNIPEQVFRKKNRVVCLHSCFYIFGISLCMNFYIIW